MLGGGGATPPSCVIGDETTWNLDLYAICFYRHESTIHLMYLQLRSDLLNDRFSCTAAQAVRLGALAARVETRSGPPPDKSATSHYLPPSLLRGRTSAGLHRTLVDQWNRMREMAPDDAKIQFIQVCSEQCCRRRFAK